MANEAVGGWTDPEDLKKMVSDTDAIEKKLEGERKPRETTESVRNRLLRSKDK